MNKAENDILNQKVGQILHLALKLVKPGSDNIPDSIPGEADLNLILSKLSAIQEEIKFKTIFIDQRTERLNKLIDVLLQYTIMDFSPKAILSEAGDEIDAVSLGVNTLGEELENHIHLLTESQANFRRLVVGVKDYAIFMIDADGYILTWNYGAERIKGYTAEEIIGRHFSIFYTDEELAKNEHVYNLNMAREKGNYESEGWRLRKDGTRFWADVIFTAVYDEHGNLKGFSKITRDITQKKKVESEILEKTQALERSNKQLEQFVYIASHDLNEPLRTLSNYVNLFSSDYRAKLDDTGLRHLQRIMNATIRMEALIHDLLEYARVGQVRDIIEINCKLLIQEVLSDLTASISESGAKIDLGELPVVYANYAGMKSVFQNLISNAIKFRKKDVLPVITINSTANNLEWTFAISDNGIGIDRQFQERIFSIFQKLHSQKEYAGTGIGLAQCKKIVEEFGGRIWIESEIGKGSTFYFTILKPDKWKKN